MPNRILKQSICTSPNLNAISHGAETLFYRLFVQCDDYGRFFANPSILRGMCYPMKLSEVTDKTVFGWMQELIDAQLVWVYEHEGIPYVQITKWKDHQQVRAAKSKFPQPPELDINCNQLISDDINGLQMSPYSYSYSYSISDANNGAAASQPPDTSDLPNASVAGKPQKPTTREIQDAYQAACGYPVKWAAGEAKAAKWLGDNGYSGAQVSECYAHLKAQDFWRDKPLSLASLSKQIGEYAKNGHAPVTGRVMRGPRE